MSDAATEEECFSWKTSLSKTDLLCPNNSKSNIVILCCKQVSLSHQLLRTAQVHQGGCSFNE